MTILYRFRQEKATPRKEKWVALVDTVIGWGKRLLHLEGGNKVAVRWHIARPTIPAEETEQMSECKEKSDVQSKMNAKDQED